MASWQRVTGQTSGVGGSGSLMCLLHPILGWFVRGETIRTWVIRGWDEESSGARREDEGAGYHEAHPHPRIHADARAPEGSPEGGGEDPGEGRRGTRPPAGLRLQGRDRGTANRPDRA